MRPECRDSNAWLRTADAFCRPVSSASAYITVHPSFRPPAEGETYLCYVVECK